MATSGIVRTKCLEPSGGVENGNDHNEAARKRSGAYLAQIARPREGKIVHRESKTFDGRVSADSWIKRREADLSIPNAVLDPAKVSMATLGDAIQHYIQQSERAMGRTKTRVLRSILKLDLASMLCPEIGSQTHLEFAQDLAATGMKPQTVENYLSHLGAVFSIARPAWGFAPDPQALSDGRKVARALAFAEKDRTKGFRFEDRKLATTSATQKVRSLRPSETSTTEISIVNKKPFAPHGIHAFPPESAKPSGRGPAPGKMAPEANRWKTARTMENSTDSRAQSSCQSLPHANPCLMPSLVSTKAPMPVLVII